MYGYICPYCGDHLDPGERCECRMEEDTGWQKLAERCARCGCVLSGDEYLVTAEGEKLCNYCLDDNGR